MVICRWEILNFLLDGVYSRYKVQRLPAAIAASVSKQKNKLIFKLSYAYDYIYIYINNHCCRLSEKRSSTSAHLNLERRENQWKMSEKGKQSSNLLHRLIDRYFYLLKHYPLATKSITRYNYRICLEMTIVEFICFGLH